MKIVLCLISLLTFNAFAETIDLKAPTKTPEDDQAKITEYNQACQVIDTLLVKKQFKVECNSNYQYYGPTALMTPTRSTLKIAGYNLLHPGTSKALFKDYSLVSKVMNQYDVVAGLEILGSVGHDDTNNQAVLSLIRTSPKMVADLRAAREKTKDLAKKKIIDEKIVKLIQDTRTAYSLYRAPGYYNILMSLKRLDPSWALILSPRGDSALEGSVEEMVGFFFRASKVSPVVNPHCNEFKDENAGSPVACIINLTSKFMDKDYSHNFARRPFMASFQAGAMKFSLISTHVVFTYSGDEEAAKKLMTDTFGVETPAELGGGINASNFARFAEVKVTLDFMNRFKKRYNDKNIMFVSDTNLSAENNFWPEVLKSFPGSSLLVNGESTISPPRYSGDGKETNGVASSYDHFILDKSTYSNCNDGEVYNYYNSPIDTDIKRIYGVRENNSTFLQLKEMFLPADEVGVGGDVPPEENPIPTQLDYPLSPSASAKIDKMVNEYSLQLKSLLTVRNNEVVNDDYLVQERIDGFKRRVFVNQLTNAFYYRFYQELLSDHFPVAITCKTN